MARSSLIPGFRFHPTDVELVMYYLKKKLMGKKITVNVVAEVNIYDFCPWDLPDKSTLKSGDLEWYFFCPKSKKYSCGNRTRRDTETGFWKATGKERTVKYKERTVATIKTLIFHLKHDVVKRTNWVMHEYRMEDEQLANAGIVQDTYVLCRIFEKSGSGPKNGEQYGAPFIEEEWDDDLASCSGSQVIIGPVGASNTPDINQMGPATTSVSGPGLSVVTISANEPTNTPNYKLKGPATTSISDLGSSMVTITANEATNNLNYKQKTPATMGPGSSMYMLSVNEPTSTMDMTLPQITHGLSVTGYVTEPGSSSVPLFTDEMPVSDDVLTLEDMCELMRAPVEAANGEEVRTMAPSEDDGIFDELMTLNNLDDFDTDGLEYAFDEFMGHGGPSLDNFFVD